MRQVNRREVVDCDKLSSTNERLGKDSTSVLCQERTTTFVLEKETVTERQWGMENSG